jgi:hypothetical protein
MQNAQSLCRLALLVQRAHQLNKCSVRGQPGVTAKLYQPQFKTLTLPVETREGLLDGCIGRTCRFNGCDLAVFEFIQGMHVGRELGSWRKRHPPLSVAQVPLRRCCVDRRQLAASRLSRRQHDAFGDRAGLGLELAGLAFRFRYRHDQTPATPRSPPPG